MSSPATFLTELAHALAASSLYAEGHPARERAIEAAYNGLVALRAQVRRPTFTFLGDEVVCGSRPVRELRNWDWATRLADAGIQRLEFEDSVTLEEFTAFTNDVLERLNLAAPSRDTAQPGREGIRFGTVGVRGNIESDETPTATFAYALGAEAEAMRWLQAQASTGRAQRLSEAQAIVSSLSVTLNDDRTAIPLLHLAGYDQYTTYHALNVTTLSMAFGQRLGLSRSEVRSLGVAALLHDLGKMKVPVEILNKPSRLDPAEFRIVKQHPEEGARMILQSGEAPDIAPVVAYEHHIAYDGSGYPSFRFPRQCHFASRLVRICDIYDALRSARPYREAWSGQRVLGYIDAGTGSEFDPQLAPAFTAMMRVIEERAAILDEPAAVRTGAPLPATA